jgi:hypothetical protein
MDRRHLAPEERAEHDGVMEEAGYGTPIAVPLVGIDGDVRPPTPFSSDQIRENMVVLVGDAVQAHRPWARILSDDALAEGLLDHWKKWNNAEQRLKVLHNGIVVPARAIRGVRRRDDSGAVVHQQEFWAEMAWDEVVQEIAMADAQIASYEVTKAIALKLLKLKITVPDSLTPGDACRRLGMDLETYLLEEILAA